MNQPADIRRFLMEFFSDEELDTFCFVHFPAVRGNFTAGMTKEQHVKLLLDHCHHHGRYQTLYDALARERPEQWSGQWAAAPGRPGPLIFLSYAWGDDKPFVEQLQADLEAAGFDVWRDETDMPSRGANLDDEFLLAIDRCHRFVPVVGPAAFQRPNVITEWAYARRMGKAITPVWRLGDVMPPDFARKLYFDFRAGQPGYDYTATLTTLKRRLAQTELPPGPLAIVGVFPDLPEGVIERAEFERLVEALWRDPNGGAAAITGRAGTLHAPGGLGKSVLAALFAQDWDTRRHFRDGVWWLSVGRDADALALLREFGRRLGESDAALQQEYADVARGRARLQTLLGDRQSLIILDDVWDSAHARAFFAPAPRCRWLITTRARGLGGELGLAPGRVIPLDYLTEEEGVRLIAGVLGLDAAAGYPDRSSHAEIARELGGHTQAIAIAAARLNPDSSRHLSPQRLLERYRERKGGHDPFVDLALDQETRETNVERSLWESYDALPDDADRQHFRLLGAFAPDSSFGVAAAMAVWEDDREAAEDGLARLVGRSLLSRAGDGRYSQHALLRAYAMAWLQREGEAAAAREQHFGYYAAAYGDKEANLPYGEPGRHDRITTDFDNIRHGLDWAFEARPDDACDLVFALDNSYMQFRQSAKAQLELVERAQKAAKSRNDRGRQARAIKALGDVHRMLGDYGAARAKYEEARPIYAGLGDRLGEANTIRALGELAGELEQEETTIQLLEEAATAFRSLGLPRDEAFCYNSMGAVMSDLKRHEEALRYFDRAIALNPDAMLHRNRADTLIDLERYDEATGALDMAESLQPGQPYLLVHRGRIALWTGQPAGAVVLLEQAVEQRPSLNGFHYALACALLAAGVVDRALAEFEQALELTHKRKDLSDTVEELARLGRAYGPLPGLDQLAERLRRALDETTAS